MVAVLLFQFEYIRWIGFIFYILQNTTSNRTNGDALRSGRYFSSIFECPFSSTYTYGYPISIAIRQRCLRFNFLCFSPWMWMQSYEIFTICVLDSQKWNANNIVHACMMEILINKLKTLNIYIEISDSRPTKRKEREKNCVRLQDKTNVHVNFLHRLLQNGMMRVYICVKQYDMNMKIEMMMMMHMVESHIKHHTQHNRPYRRQTQFWKTLVWIYRHTHTHSEKDRALAAISQKTKRNQL